MQVTVEQRIDSPKILECEDDQRKAFPEDGRGGTSGQLLDPKQYEQIVIKVYKYPINKRFN
jgi:hypothetical protein